MDVAKLTLRAHFTTRCVTILMHSYHMILIFTSTSNALTT